ncbi:MAG TPA: amidohydrolase family protein [Sphingomicrobium sp.]|nr:amidohydrolase family protein [Sphingomicrobium sp.]
MASFRIVATIARELGPCLLAASVSANAAVPPPPHPNQQVTAIVDVNVVPMDTERVLQDQTVIIEGGKIAAIGSGLPIPPNARVIRAKGEYLSPGLADMHTHSTTREDLAVYLANGVTTVLNMGGATSGFMDTIRPGANSGVIPGPHVYAGFMLDGSPRYNNFFVTTPEQARAIVGIGKTNGYDFIKVYNDLSEPAFNALASEGKIEHVPIIGHGVSAVGLRRQLDAGQVMVAHTEEFLYTVFYDPAHLPSTGAPDASKIPGVIDFVLRHKAFVTADLNTYATIAHQWGKPTAVNNYLRMPEVKYLRPDDRIRWARADYADRQGSIDARLSFLRQFTKAMNDKGVNLIAGTDAPSIAGLVPGYSLHDDLAALRSAGLTPFDVLSTATRIPGKFIQATLPAEEPFGTVTVGSRADLVLTAKNPLKALSTLRTPIAVMAHGQWYSASRLHALLDLVAAEYRRALNPAISAKRSASISND